MMAQTENKSVHGEDKQMMQLRWMYLLKQMYQMKQVKRMEQKYQMKLVKQMNQLVFRKRLWKDLWEEFRMRYDKRYRKSFISFLVVAMLLSGCGTAVFQGSAVPSASEKENEAARTVENGEEGEFGEAMKNGEAVESKGDLETVGTEEIEEIEETGAVIAENVNHKDEDTDAARVYARGPYGRISVILPDSWLCEPYSVNSEKSNSGSYGMWIHPAEEETGYIDLFYMQMFGVCGTGLKQETVTLAGGEANVGTYDQHEMWDFICFHGDNEGVTAQSVMSEEWSVENRETAMHILDTLTFEPDKAEGAVSYFKRDSEIVEIGVIADAYDITSHGATVRFRVWDPELADGELEYGDDYSLERLDGEAWTPVPVIFDGEWAINSIAYIIPKEPENSASDWAVDWEWLYGELEPGDYRIGKSVLDFRGSGDYDTYTVYVYFHYAGEAGGDETGEAFEDEAGEAGEDETGEVTEGDEDEGSVREILPEDESDKTQNTYADLSAEEFLYGNQHWEWWSLYIEAVNHSAELQDGMDIFNSHVLQELLITDSGENTVCSPLNLYLALAMLAETAEGNTRQQILDALQAEDIDTLRDRVAALWEANAVDIPTVKSRLASSLWLRNDIRYHEDTLQLLAANHHAASYVGKMGSSEMNDALRKWTDGNTGGLLSEYADTMELRPQTALALVSTLYYKAAWVDEFQIELTDKGIFHGLNGDAEVDMMHRREGMSIYDRDLFSAISLRLNDSGEMYFFLPKEETTPEEVLADPEMLNILHRKDRRYIGYATVNMTVPRFIVRQKTDLMDHLDRLGITDAAVAGLADFSPLTDEATNVYLSTAEHAAMVEIDEEGVTGAAYTELMLDGATAIEPEPVDFILDRPFFFAIVAPDGSLLFAGIIHDVAE